MNNILKKIATFLLPLGMILTGCGTPTSGPTTEAPTTSGPTSEQPTIPTVPEVELPIDGDKVVYETKLVTYDGPDLMESSKQVDIKVNGESIFVYETRVNNMRKFTWEMPSIMAPVALFDFEGKVHVEITVPGETITTARVSPFGYGVQTSINDNKIEFDLSYPSNYVVEYNGDPDKAIHIFANEIEEDPITEEDAANDPSIVYIGPGLYKADAIPTESNTTIYIAGGAYVYGQIRTEGLENITIRGHGIISGSIYHRRTESEYTIPVELRTTNNVLIKDITFLDPAGWTIALWKSTNITLDNIKIISARQNGDGISVQSCENVNVYGGFVRTWDDSLVVKNEDRGSTKDILFDGVTVWTDLAQSMEVGYETYGDTMDNITFQNITIVHNFHKAAISIHNCDDADITNVTYKNITLEDGQMLGDDRDDGESDFLIDFTIAYNMEWTQSAGERGTINGVNIENVKVLSLLDSIDCRMNGESEISSISNVSIKGLEIEGKQVTNEEELKLLKNEYTSNITISTLDKVTGATIYAPYKLNLGTSEVKSSHVDAPIQEGMIVPSFSVMKGELSFIGSKARGEFVAAATHGAGTKASAPYDDGTGPFEVNEHKAAHAIDNDPNTYFETPDWKGEEDEFAAVSVTFDRNITVGVIRILGNVDNKFFYNYKIQVWGIKLKADGTVNDKYTRILSSKDVDMTPSNGNAIDVNISTQEYAALQVRFYKVEGPLAAKTYQISEIEFYPPSLSFNKAIVDSTKHEDVYNVEKVVDGEKGGTSYYESAELPAYFVVDLGDIYKINTLGFFLPPSLLWSARSQVIEVLYSDSNTNYTSSMTFKSMVEQKSYLFDPATGNRNIVTLDSSIDARFIKVVISSNDINGGYKAQLSEFCVYGD